MELQCPLRGQIVGRLAGMGFGFSETRQDGKIKITLFGGLAASDGDPADNIWCDSGVEFYIKTI